jgi:hypothetical protein
LKRIKIYKIGKFDTIFSTNEDPIGKKNINFEEENSKLNV